MDDPTLWSTRQQAAAIAKRELSSRELLDQQLARIEAVNPAINAVVTLDAERARGAADAADAAVASGDDLGPLHGVPITLKDAYEVAGWRSTGGSVQLAEYVPAEDTPAVGRLRDAGVVVVGRTNVPEWSGDVQTFNALFGTTNNPWDTSRVPGGSSGGAAAAVATGMSSFEMGTDIGGSIRIPSSYCGVCGHKPSWGVVPTTGYLDHPNVGRAEREVNVFGPIARTVDDLETILDVIAGPTARRSVAWHLELPPPRATVAGQLRVATWFDDPVCPPDTATRARLDAAAGLLADAGARVEAAQPAGLDFGEAALVGLGVVIAEISVSPSQEAFDALVGIEGTPEIGGNAGVITRHRSWLELQEIRQRHHRAWTAFFEDWDVLLAPVIVTAAFEHVQEGDIGERFVPMDGTPRPYLDLIMWTTMIGSAELPSTVVPVGRTPEGLPVGIQIIGPHLEDRTTLAAGRLLEALTGGYEPPPLVTN